MSTNLESFLVANLSPPRTSEILLRANVNVIAMSRSETPEITSLASKYPGALVISQGNVAEDLHNKAAVDLALQSFGRLDSVRFYLHPLVFPQNRG